MKIRSLGGVLFLFSSALFAPDSHAAEPGALTVAPGFVAEELLAAGADDGSWSAMTVDDRGRFIISPQGRERMLRVTVAEGGAPPLVEKLAVPVTSAMGLLFAFDHIYVNGVGPKGFGLYRLSSSNFADGGDELTLLRQFEGRVDGEHGSHGLVLGADRRIYVAQGNHVLPPQDLLPSSPYKHGAEDQLLPSANYGVSGGDKCKAPCGHILRMDPDGKNVEIFAAGFRNIYDLAFDTHGEMFVFDSDTEYNWGLPWYVPNRILHVVSGGDYGFREGTGKWPSSYPDTLPPVVNVGLGSPTGVKFGTGSAFPENYKRALFALDWTFGRILAVHLEPRGASFTGRFETFVQGRPLNVTDIEFGRDGAMYFITGGRKTRSALYRVRYTGDAQSASNTTAASEQAEERRSLEFLHGKAGARTTRAVWPALGSDDRFLRHAARVALEAQPVAEWREKPMTENEPWRALTGLLALARVGTQSDRATALAEIARWWPRLHDDEALQLSALRVAEVALTRHAEPYPATKHELLRALDASYPSVSPALNRELAQLLIALEAPGVVPRTLALAQRAATVEEQLHFIFALRKVHTGWSREDRVAYFGWFPRPHRSHAPEVTQWFTDLRLQYADGASVQVYLANIRREAADGLSDVERKTLAPLIDTPVLPAPKPIDVKPRRFVKEWTTTELQPLVQKLSGPRSVERGRAAFAAANCVACHRYANEGGAVGPDLTAVAYKFGNSDMLESLVEPSKVISDQFQNTIVELATGQVRVGRIVERRKEKIVMSMNPYGGDREEILRSDIASTHASPVSPMPSGLLNTLSSEEILDLLAYLGFGAP